MSNQSNYYEGRRVLVTGGLGFIGSNLAVRLAELGAKVTVADSALSGCGANPHNLEPFGLTGIDWIEADIADAAFRFPSLLRETQTVFNLAGEISHSRSMTDPARDLRINTVSQLEFLLACRDLCPSARVVYAGTRQVYGRPLSLPVDESHPINPVDFNGIHKHAAEQQHEMLTRTAELDTVVLRLSNVYGPRMALHLPHQGFLGVYLRRALLGEPIRIYGDGSQLRDPVHVDDVVDAFLAAGSRTDLPFRLFNVGGPRPLSLREIAHIAAACSPASGCRVESVPFPEHLLRVDIGSYYTDNSRLRANLGVHPSIDFADGLRQTIQWFSQRPANQYLFVDEAPAAPAEFAQSLQLSPAAR